MRPTEKTPDGIPPAEFKWMRNACTARGIRDICDRCIVVYYNAAGGDLSLAMRAIEDVAAGRISDELRAKLSEQERLW